MKTFRKTLLPTDRPFVLFIVMLVLVGCASVMMVKHLRAVFSSHDDTQSRVEINLTANLVNERLRARLIQLQALAYIPSSQTNDLYDPQRIARLRAKATEYGYLRLGITNTEGHVVTTDGNTFDVSDEAQFQHALRGFLSSSGVMLDVVPDRLIGNREIIVFESPIFMGASIVGTLSATMRLADAKEFLDGVSLPYNGSALILIDKDFCVIATSGVFVDERMYLGRSCSFFSFMSGSLTNGEEETIRKHLADSGQEGFVSYNTVKDDRSIAFIDLPDTDGWHLVVVASEEGLREAQSALVKQTGRAFLAVVLLILAVLVHVYVINWRYKKVTKFSHALMDSSGIDPILLTRDGLVTDCDTDFRKSFGLPAKGEDFSLTQFMEDGGRKVFPRATMNEGDSFRIGLRRKDDAEMTYLMINVLGKEEGGSYPAVAIDVTADEKLHERVRVLAYTDPVTRLPNIESFTLKVEELRRKCNEAPFKCAYIFVSVANSHKILEIFSDRAHRNVMLEAASRISAIAGEFGMSTFCIRNSEFAIAFSGYDDDSMVELVCQKIMQAFNKPFNAYGSTIQAECRVGLVAHSEHTGGTPVSSNDILRRGAIALNKAERSVDGMFTLNDRSITEIEDGLDMEVELTRALDNNEFELYYQPLYNADADKIIGAEALLRWHNPKRGMVPPSVFIPLAENSGEINRIGDFVTDSALDFAKDLEKLGIKLEFNVSPVQLMQVGFADEMIRKFENSGLKKGFVGMEITESCLINDAASVTLALARIRQAGLLILIDDFGTGFSSLQYLKDLPADYVKIDRSFVNEVTSNEKALAILNAMVSIGKTTGMGLIAEGVETSDELNSVLHSGCNLIQGYFIAKPMPAAEFLVFTDRFNNNGGKV